MVNDNGVLESDLRKEFQDAVLSKLLDVVAGRLAAKGYAFGANFDRQVPNSPIGANLHPLLKLPLEALSLLKTHVAFT